MTKLLDTKTFDNERLKRLMDQVVNECKFYKNQIKEYKKVRLFIYFFNKMQFEYFKKEKSLVKI